MDPCQPTLAPRPPAGPEWLHEIKQDGYRIIARKDGDRVRLWTRQAKDMTREFARIAAGLGSLDPRTVTLDGEAVVLRPDGHGDFAALRSRQAAEAVLIAFDLLERNGTDLRPLPIEERWAELERMLWNPRDGLLFSKPIEAEGVIVLSTLVRWALKGSYRNGEDRVTSLENRGCGSRQRTPLSRGHRALVTRIRSGIGAALFSVRPR